MKFIVGLFVMIDIFLSGNSLADQAKVKLVKQGNISRESKKVIKYRKHSEVNLTGSMVKGKIRAPEVFYIFQLKRKKAVSFVRPVRNFNHHHELTIDILKGQLPR